jgi:hypothetical protein
MMLVIVGAIVFLSCVSIALIVRRFRTRTLELRPARQPQSARRKVADGAVVLRYASGTTVELDEAIEHPTAAGSVVSPMPRRLPGLMPTAGYVVVSKPRPSRSMAPPKLMDFSDD